MCVCVCARARARVCACVPVGAGVGTGRDGIKGNDSFSLYIAVSHMTHVVVYYTLLVVIIICITFVKLRKCLRML